MALDYPVTRSFQWRWFTTASIFGGVVAIALLTAVNVALTGYETVTVFQSDFNVTQSYWYDRFMPYRAQKAGTLCDSHIFNVGDPLTTNYTLFEWNIESITTPNAGASGVSYKGSVLTGCDVSSVYINGDLRTWSMDITAVVECKNVNEFEVNAKTSFSVTSLPGKHSPLLGVVRSKSGSGKGDPRAVVVDVLAQKATEDVAARTAVALYSSNYTAPVALSVQVDFTPCPASLGPAAPCAISVPRFNISYAAAIYTNATLIQSTSYEPVSAVNPQIIDDNTLLPITNLIHLVYASVRLDLGNPSPNNFILHPDVTNQTLTAKFPTTEYDPTGANDNSTLYYIWNNRERLLEDILPLNISGPANIQVVYLCRFQRRKSVGSLIISVLVATLSMFSSGWAVFMAVAATFAKTKDPSANRCEAHTYDHQQPYVGDSATDSYPLSTGISYPHGYEAVKAKA